MTICETNKIDIVSIKGETGTVVLTIADHLEWVDDGGEHLFLLQEKLNSYLTFCESGQLIDEFPNAADRPIRISLRAKYPPNEAAHQFFEKAKKIVSDAGFDLQVVVS